MVTIIMVDVWEWTPFVALSVLASLQTRSQDQVEGALIDGANTWQIFRYITYPHIQPILFIAGSFRLGALLRWFDTIYVMTAGGAGAGHAEPSDVYLPDRFLLYEHGLFRRDRGDIASIDYSADTFLCKAVQDRKALRRRNMMQDKKGKHYFRKILRSGDWKLTLLTYLVALLFAFPILWIFMMALKTSVDAFSLPPKLFFKPVFENFKNVFQNNYFVTNYRNSFILAFTSTAFSLLLGIPAAYAITRFSFRGKKTLSFWILVTRMAPASAMVVAYFMILNQLKMIDTLPGIVMVYMSFNIGYIIWMVRGFVLSVPIECEEASVIDGCTRFMSFYRITLPLCVPGIVSVGIQSFIFSWNEFLYALILTRTNYKTAPIAVLSYVTSEGIAWGELAAASTLIVLPVLVLALIVAALYRQRPDHGRRQGLSQTYNGIGIA